MNNTITQNLMVGLLKFKLFRLLYNYAMQSRLRFVFLFVIPLFGTLFLGWRYILLFYWLENVVIGIFVILRILFNSDKKYSFSVKVLSAAFTAFIYYFAAFVIGVFVLIFSVLIFTPEVVTDIILNQKGDELDVWQLLNTYVITNALWNYIYILLAFHLIDYIWKHVVKRGYSKTSIDDIAIDAIMHRTMVLHLSTILTGFIASLPGMVIHACLAIAAEYFNYDISTVTTIAIRVLEACVIVIMTGANIAILKGRANSFGVKREYTSWRE